MPLCVLPAVEVDGCPRERVTLLRWKEVVFLFLGSKRVIDLIIGLRDRSLPLRKDRVYVRARGTIFRTGFRMITELVDHVRDPDLLRANQGIFVHLAHSGELDIRGRLLGVVIAYRSGVPEHEYIILSRRGLAGIRRRLVLPGRTTPSPSGPGFDE